MDNNLAIVFWIAKMRKNIYIYIYIYIYMPRPTQIKWYCIMYYTNTKKRKLIKRRWSVDGKLIERIDSNSGFDSMLDSIQILLQYQTIQYSFLDSNHASILRTLARGSFSTHVQRPVNIQILMPCPVPAMTTSSSTSSDATDGEEVKFVVAGRQSSSGPHGDSRLY